MRDNVYVILNVVYRETNMSEIEVFNQFLLELSPVPLDVMQVPGTNKFNLMSGTRGLYQG